MGIRTKTRLLYGFRFVSKEEQTLIDHLWYDDEDFISICNKFETSMPHIAFDLETEGNTITSDPLSLVMGLNFGERNDISVVQKTFHKDIVLFVALSKDFNPYFTQTPSWYTVTHVS